MAASLAVDILLSFSLEGGVLPYRLIRGELCASFSLLSMLRSGVISLSSRKEVSPSSKTRFCCPEEIVGVFLPRMGLFRFPVHLWTPSLRVLFRLPEMGSPSVVFSFSLELVCFPFSLDRDDTFDPFSSFLLKRAERSSLSNLFLLA